MQAVGQVNSEMKEQGTKTTVQEAFADEITCDLRFWECIDKCYITALDNGELAKCYLKNNSKEIDNETLEYKNCSL